MLPGVHFVSQPRSLGEALPRMDVAAFVGFAARGPLHLPVAVDDENAFVDIFGESLQLARERSSGQPVQGHLAAAVRAFFANGGRRCWVVRVAGEAAAANRFQLRGMGHAERRDAGWQLSDDLFAVARCEGSWSDGLQVTAQVFTRPVTLFEVRQAAEAAPIELRLRASPMPVVGDLLRIDTGDGTSQAWLPVSRLRRQDDGSVSVECDRALRLSAAGVPRGDADAAFIAAMPQPRVRILNLTLQVSDSRDGSMRRLEGLGLARGHVRDWRLLSDDSALYDPAARPSALAGARFPLAAELGSAATAGGFDLPRGFESGLASGPEPSASGALDRDGLAQYDAALFLDPGLADVPRHRLLERADELRYTGRPETLRALRGLHALLGGQSSVVQEEVTLVAVPDAVHRPWRVVGAAADGPQISELPPDAMPQAPASTFADCASSRLPGPAWRLSGCSLAGGKLIVVWQPGPELGGLHYRLEANTTPDFATPETVQSLPVPTATLLGQEAGQRFLRVRCEVGGRIGEWSSVLRASVGGAPVVEIDPDAGEPALWPVHRALLRLAAACGDVFALLALPAGWREDAALQHTHRLMALDGFDVSPSTGSFGALYHPWTLVADGQQGLVAVPPDGLAAGLLARRARERGAWIAPANEALRGVVALSPPLLPGRWEELQDGRVNVLRREPAAFVVLSEATLAGEAELASVHVRRLLSLLRRLAVRLGAEFVFEPNDAALRLSLRTRCEWALERLYRRGAFAGATSDAAFQVSVRGDIDASRLVVELRVRPAPALGFITVRLTQAGAESSVAEML